jgi:uncharacterized protein (DUF488 family)
VLGLFVLMSLSRLHYCVESEVGDGCVWSYEASVFGLDVVKAIFVGLKPF